MLIDALLYQRANQHKNYFTITFESKQGVMLYVEVFG
jgi:hypothetical protein